MTRAMGGADESLGAPSFAAAFASVGSPLESGDGGLGSETVTREEEAGALSGRMNLFENMMSPDGTAEKFLVQAVTYVYEYQQWLKTHIECSNMRYV